MNRNRNIYKQVSVLLQVARGPLCALWECPHVSSDGGDLDHVLPLPSPHVLVHHQALVPREEHVVPPQLVPCQADVGTALLPVINQGCRSPHRLCHAWS